MTDFERVLLEEKDRQIQDYKNLFLIADKKRELLQQELDKLKEGKQKTAYWDDTTGHWIEGDRDGTDPNERITGEMIDTYKCSWCGFYQYWKTPFCPNCGSKMASEIQDGEQE